MENKAIVSTLKGKILWARGKESCWFLMASELILIVDDNEGIRSLLKEVLENNGYKVEVAPNGEEAIEKFHKCAPSIVLAGFKDARDERCKGSRNIKNCIS